MLLVQWSEMSTAQAMKDLDWARRGRASANPDGEHQTNLMKALSEGDRTAAEALVDETYELV